MVTCTLLTLLILSVEWGSYVPHSYSYAITHKTILYCGRVYTAFASFGGNWSCGYLNGAYSCPDVLIFLHVHILYFPSLYSTVCVTFTLHSQDAYHYHRISSGSICLGRYAPELDTTDPLHSVFHQSNTDNPAGASHKAKNMIK